MRFGRLVVLGQAPRLSKAIRWHCKCDCGGSTISQGHSLRHGMAQSCGCLAIECTRQRNTTHGHTGSETYQTWVSMLQRCENPNTVAYHCYGGRGIKVCERWHEFENFLADMGERPSGKTIDRYPNKDGNYEPGNCRWATPKEQAGNRRSNLIDLTGMRFGQLVVLGQATPSARGHTRWHCRCDCGKLTISHGSSLRRGGARSCGCSRQHSFTQETPQWLI
jgi:hypothetical protein